MVRFYAVYLCLLFVNALLVQTIKGDDEESDDGEQEEEELCPCIILSVNEDATECSDFTNDKLLLDLKMKVDEGNDKGSNPVKMDGVLELKQSIDQGLEVELSLYFNGDQGDELVTALVADLCSSLSDADAPWSGVARAINATECPVNAVKAELKDFLLDTSFADCCLTHKYIGTYMAELLIKNGLDTFFCITLGVQIYEAQKPCDECPSAPE